jgi:hypothetical protein
MGFLAVVWVFLIALAGHPIHAFAEQTSEEQWQPYHEGNGIVYTFAPESILHGEDRVQVRARAVDLANERCVTTVLYEIDCRKGTFRMIRVVEERGGEKSVCNTPSDDLPISPAKNPHLSILRNRVCPPLDR